MLKPLPCKKMSDTPTTIIPMVNTKIKPVSLFSSIFNCQPTINAHKGIRTLLTSAFISAFPKIAYTINPLRTTTPSNIQQTFVTRDENTC